MFFTKSVREKTYQFIADLTEECARLSNRITELEVYFEAQTRDVAADRVEMRKQVSNLHSRIDAYTVGMGRVTEEEAEKIVDKAIEDFEDTVEANHNVLADGMNDLLETLVVAGVLKVTGHDPETGHPVYGAVKDKRKALTPAKKGSKK